MENSNDHHHHEADQKVETLDLLEESWFFENLFNRRRKMLRCCSDTCSSTPSNFSKVVLENHISCNQSSKSTNKSQDKGSAHYSLIPEVQARNNNGGSSKLNRQLSLQASTTTTKKKHEIQEEIIKTDGKSKLSEESRPSNLLRTPSLPTSLGMEELIQDDESDIRMSNLIRQALANPANSLAPRNSPNKAMTRSCSMQRCRPPRNLEMETNDNTNMIQEMRRRYSNQKMLQKSHSDLAFQELQGFKDLGFTFDKEDLSPGVVDIIPGLQENATVKVIRRPYLSEAWLVQGRAITPIPNCVSKNSEQDMKAQLKFWARAVATNVRQEC